MKPYDIKKKIPALAQAVKEACVWVKGGPGRLDAVNNAGIARFLLPSRLLLRAQAHPPDHGLLFTVQVPRGGKYAFSLKDLSDVTATLDKIRPVRKQWDGMIEDFSYVRSYIFETEIDPEWEKCVERYETGCEAHPRAGKHCTCLWWMLRFDIARPKGWHT